MTFEEVIARGWCPHLYREVQAEAIAARELQRQMAPVLEALREGMSGMIAYDIIPVQPSLGHTKTVFAMAPR